MSLKSNFESVQCHLKDALEASQYTKDESVAQVLDDILLRQKFWAEDVGFENDPYGSISKEPSEAVETMKHLTAMRTLLSEMKMALSGSQKSSSKFHNLVEEAHVLQRMNQQFCQLEEIFNILDDLYGHAQSTTKTGPHKRSYTAEEAPVSSSTPPPSSSMDSSAINRWLNEPTSPMARLHMDAFGRTGENKARSPTRRDSLWRDETYR